MPAGSAPTPLAPEEEQTWRALIRLMVLLPRAIDDDLFDRTGLSLTRYVVLMRLSEAPGHSLRMSELADAASISPSRMSRIIASMTTDKLVTRRVDPADGRATLAILGDPGLRRLREAWPAHLAGVRALVMDHLDPADLAGFHRVVDQLVQVIETSTGNRPAQQCQPQVSDAPHGAA